jgi:hypothetical protein
MSSIIQVVLSAFTSQEISEIVSKIFVQVQGEITKHML